MTKSLMFFFTILSLFLYIEADERGSSSPFISGDSFRIFSKFTYDELGRSFKPSKVKKGDTVFVKTDYLEEFFLKVHPKIKSKYILITHNSDYHVPGSFANYLEDPKIIAWFGQNVEGYVHPKLKPIPIGIANRCWPHGNINILKSMVTLKDKSSRDTMLYMNFSEGTYPERSLVFRMFKDKSYCSVSSPKNYQSYLEDLARVKFVLSPRGNGLDCHRTWESLLMGAIPIVKTSSLDPLFEGLPVLIINEWNEINEEFLEREYARINSEGYGNQRAYVNYWFEIINSFK